MPVLKNIGLLARCLDEGPQDEVHAIRNAAVAWAGPVIKWVGPEADLPAEYQNMEVHDAAGKLVVPGLVDCHTHLAFGGWRADEFVDRIRGKSYLEIAEAGGGIQRTVSQTRERSVEELVERSAAFLDEMLRLGVTTVEAKTGYGLDRETELRQLEVYRLLSNQHPIRIVPTFLAHTVPTDFQKDRDAYVDMITDGLLPEIAAGRLAEFCDVFIEETAFSPAEARRILEAAADLGLGLKIHADQLTNLESAALAAELGAASADHLEKISEEGILAMAGSQTIAVSLPLASLYLRVDVLPARALLTAGVPVAVATDFNPGSAPSYHLPLAMSLACITQRMTPNESLNGATMVAAKALRREREIGSVEVGKSADLVLIDADDVDHWLYHIRGSVAKMVVCRGHAHPV